MRGQIIAFAALLVPIACGGGGGGGGGAPPTGPPAPAPPPPPAATEGSIEVVVTSTGVELDDAYRVDVAGFTLDIGESGSRLVAGLAPGTYEVRLTDLAINCEIAGGKLRSVTVVAGGTVRAEFASTCSPGLAGTIIFSAGSHPGQVPTRIMSMTANGSHRQRISSTGHIALDVSADGQVIVAKCGSEICRLNRDGTELTTLGPGARPMFSPDGTRILFHARGGSDNFDIWAMDADGTNRVNLTTASTANEQFPDWFPDGSQIVYNSDRNPNTDLFIADADGTNERPLTTTGRAGWQAKWSPDGMRLAFTLATGGDDNVWVINADGTGLTNLTPNTGSSFEADPQWSPDSRHIVFMSSRDQGLISGFQGADIFVMDADGSNPRNLTQGSAAISLAPTWVP
jgi:Tol biopolymer transport system component